MLGFSATSNFYISRVGSSCVCAWAVDACLGSCMAHMPALPQGCLLLPLVDLLLWDRWEDGCKRLPFTSLPISHPSYATSLSLFYPFAVFPLSRMACLFISLFPPPFLLLSQTIHILFTLSISPGDCLMKQLLSHLFLWPTAYFSWFLSWGLYMHYINFCSILCEQISFF